MRHSYLFLDSELTWNFRGDVALGAFGLFGRRLVRSCCGVGMPLTATEKAAVEGFLRSSRGSKRLRDAVVEKLLEPTRTHRCAGART